MIISTDITDDYILKYIQEIPTATKSRGNNAGRGKKQIIDCISAFDIETSRIDELTFMYIWAFSFDGELTIYGRSWSEFIRIVEIINNALGDRTLVCFVHNLAYEWQFIKTLHEFDEDSVFLIDSRKPLYCKWDNIEFRCSYRWSNMSLDKLTSSLEVEHRKLDGSAFDYSKVRYPDTELTEYELAYMANDVIGLCEAVKKKMALDGDNIYKLPYTSTGYVRRDAKKAMRSFSRHTMLKMQPDFYQYQALREAFRGGNTHANRFYAREIQTDCHGVDKASSYPWSAFERLPMGPWSYRKNPKLTDIKDLNSRGRALLMRVRLWDIRLKDFLWPVPYLASAKCRYLTNEILDNGRILQADYLETTITDIDLAILQSEYYFDIEIIELWHSKYGYLPQPLRSTIMDYYRSKTELKGIEDQKYFYNQRKAKLNSCYGMMVQNVVKAQWKYRDGEEVQEPFDRSTFDNLMKKQFLSYPWGVWITARSRWDLERAIRYVHESGADFLYCDTDSVKYRGTIDWTEFNKPIIKGSRKKKTYAADKQDIIRYLGVWELDGDYKQFVTLGAKKYCYTDDSGLHLTLAGVNPRAGAADLGRIENFREGYIFDDTSAGIEAKYFDEQQFERVEINGHTVELTSYVSLLPGSYTIGLTQDYKKLLTDPAYYLDSFDNDCF